MIDPLVTVAVISWNTRDLLAECLESMRSDVEAGLIEVHVYDNASTDGSPDLVDERFHWANLTRGRDNLGFGRAVNRVAAGSRARWIAPANADIRLTPGAIRTLLDAGASDTDAGLIAPRLILPDGSTQNSIGAFQTVSRAAAEFLELGRVSDRMRLRIDPYLDQKRGRRVDWVAGAFVIVRADAFRESGGFQESQWMYAEDIDLSWRLRKRGWATRYVPQATVFHQHSAAADKAFGAAGVESRQHHATWVWSVQRLGRMRTAAVALLALTAGCVRVFAGTIVRRGVDTGRRQIAFGGHGLRTCVSLRRRHT